MLRILKLIGLAGRNPARDIRFFDMRFSKLADGTLIGPAFYYIAARRIHSAVKSHPARTDALLSRRYRAMLPAKTKFLFIRIIDKLSQRLKMNLVVVVFRTLVKYVLLSRH
jgi:hypothetical protein